MRFTRMLLDHVRLRSNYRTFPPLSPLTSPTFFLRSVSPSRCVVQIFPFVFRIASSISDLAIFSLFSLRSCRLLRFCPPINCGVSLPLLCSLISLLFSSLPLLSTSLAFLSLSCFPFFFFASLLPVSCLVFSPLLSLESRRLLLSLLGTCRCVPRHPTTPTWQRTSRSAHSPPAATCLLLPDGKGPKSRILVFRHGRGRVRPRGW